MCVAPISARANVTGTGSVTPPSVRRSGSVPEETVSRETDAESTRSPEPHQTASPADRSRSRSTASAPSTDRDRQSPSDAHHDGADRRWPPRVAEADRDNAAPPPEARCEPRSGANGDAVGQEMPPAKRGGVFDHLVEVEPDGRIVGGDDGTGADTDDRVQGHLMTHQLPEHAGMRSAAQTASAQYDPDAHALHDTIGRSAPDECNDEPKRSRPARRRSCDGSRNR